MAEMKPGPFLNGQDVGTTTWAKLKQHYEQRLATLRKANDQDLGPEETANLRGRIREVRAFLKLDEETPSIDFPATDGQRKKK